QVVLVIDGEVADRQLLRAREAVPGGEGELQAGEIQLAPHGDGDELERPVEISLERKPQVHGGLLYAFERSRDHHRDARLHAESAAGSSRPPRMAAATRSEDKSNRARTDRPSASMAKRVARSLRSWPTAESTPSRKVKISQLPVVSSKRGIVGKPLHVRKLD